MKYKDSSLRLFFLVFTLLGLASPGYAVVTETEYLPLNFSPVQANELTPPNLVPVAAHELPAPAVAPVAANELPPPAVTPVAAKEVLYADTGNLFEPTRGISAVAQMTISPLRPEPPPPPRVETRHALSDYNPAIY